MTAEGVSRDTLEAALSKLELRLVQQLASADRVKSLEDRVLTKDAVKEIIAEALRDSAARGWTARERWMGVLVVAVTVATFVVNVLAVHP